MWINPPATWNTPKPKIQPTNRITNRMVKILIIELLSNNSLSNSSTTSMALHLTRDALLDGPARSSRGDYREVRAKLRVKRVAATRILIRQSYCTGTVPLTGMPPMLPVMVSDVTPVGTVILNEVDEVVFAITALGGTTPG